MKGGIVGAVVGIAIAIVGAYVYNLSQDKGFNKNVTEKGNTGVGDSAGNGQTTQPSNPQSHKGSNKNITEKGNTGVGDSAGNGQTTQPSNPQSHKGSNKNVTEKGNTGVGNSAGNGQTTPPTPSSMEPIVKKTIKPQAVDRVFPKVMKGNFAMVGRGEDAKWGIGRAANFQYNIFILAESEIISKEAREDGIIRVVEKRTFNKVQDSVVVSDVDLKLAIDTLPVGTFSKMIDGVAVGYTSLTGDAVTGATVVAGKNYLVEKLRSIDGLSARKLLGFIGFQPTPDIDAALNKLARSQFTKALGVVRSISGKSYVISYYQEKNGQPLLVTFKNADGSEVTDDEEKMILKRVNAFIDYNVVPDEDCRPGDTWTIAAEDMQEVFDPFVDGTYTGNIKANRKSNAENGDWTVEMSPSSINVIADNGSTTGSLQLNRGRALVNPEKLSVNEMFVAGKAKIAKTSRHHLLFTARIDGLCDFQGRVVTTPKEK